MRRNTLMEWNSKDSWKVFLLLSIIFVVFSGLFNHTVWTPDEPRVVAVIKDMYLSDNLIIPHFAGIPFVEKPPLYFIYCVSLMHLTGLDALMAARLGLGLLCLASLVVTFRLAWLLKGKEYAWLTLGVLASSEGFLLNFHWLRVDAMMMFTSIVAIWAFAEAYLRFQLRYVLLAGALTGLAFLSKGPIAIILCVGPAWLVLFIRYVYLRQRGAHQSVTWGRVLFFHMMGFIIMCLVIAAWVYPFYKQASPALWHAWFWDNQIGRLTGSSTKTLGHNHQGKPFYYVSSIIEYTLPWSVFFIIGLASSVKRAVTRHQVNWLDGFFLFWFCFAVFILSYSATKRPMYLAPLMPLFALMIASALMTLKGSWSNWYRRAFLVMMIVIIAVFAMTPLWAQLLPSNKVPQALMLWLSSWQVTALWVLFAIILMIKVEVTQWPGWTKLSLISSLFFIAIFHYVFSAVDIAKDMRHDLNTFVKQIPQDKRERTAGIGFSETMSSIFYLYDDWSVPMVDKARAQRILEGKDSEYDYLILDRTGSTQDPIRYMGLPSDTPYHLLLIGHPRSDKKRSAILWLTGDENKTLPMVDVSENTVKQPAKAN